MKTTRTALVAVLLPLVLGGCASLRDWMHPAARVAHCNSQVCHVEVTVDASCKPDSSDIKIATNAPDVRIIWKINGAGEFPANGIVIRQGPPGHFSAPLAVGPHFKYDFRNSPRDRKWKFDINVKVGDRICTLDPFIMN